MTEVFINCRGVLIAKFQIVASPALVIKIQMEREPNPIMLSADKYGDVVKHYCREKDREELHGPTHFDW